MDLNENIIDKYTIINKQFTLYTDLTNDEAAIFKKIKRTTKTKIHKATKEGVRFNYYTSKELKNNDKLLELFKSCYENMFKSKGIHKEFNMDLIKSYIDKNLCLVTTASIGDKILVYHLFFIDKYHARHLYSCSEFRTDTENKNLIGRANNFLLWNDICYLKKIGIKVYDWGGISDFDNPNGIDQFKMNFRGNRKTYYNLIRGVSLRGKFVIRLLKIRKYVKQVVSRKSITSHGKYIFRLDDICENMNWENFDKIKQIFIENDVKPIIGVIPNNQDKELKSYPKCSGDFWKEVKELQDEKGWTVALHGYNHVYDTCDSGILGINNRSEFAGLSKEVQNEKIKDGIEIL